MQATLNEKAYQYTRAKLTHRVLRPGQRLVTRALAIEMGVRFAPVREALHRLATAGLVEHVPGAGSFAREPNHEDLEEIYILRDATESGAEDCFQYGRSL